MERVFTTDSPEETAALGEWFGGMLKGREVICFYGDLGAGKTRFTEGMVKGMGIDAAVSSPTFSLVNEYHGEKSLFHFDMYRINTEEELYSIGFFDYLERPGVIAVEWTENIEQFLPLPDFTVEIVKVGGSSRKITIKGDESIDLFGD